MRRIRNPVYGFAVTWVRIPPSPPIPTPFNAGKSVRRSIRRAKIGDHQASYGHRIGTKDFYVEDPDGHVISFGGDPKTNDQQ